MIKGKQKRVNKRLMRLLFSELGLELSDRVLEKIFVGYVSHKKVFENDALFCSSALFLGETLLLNTQAIDIGLFEGLDFMCYQRMKRKLTRASNSWYKVFRSLGVRYKLNTLFYSGESADILDMVTLKAGVYNFLAEDGVEVLSSSEVKESILVSKTKVSVALWDTVMFYNPLSTQWAEVLSVDCRDYDDSYNQYSGDDEDEEEDDDSYNQYSSDDEDEEDDDDRYNPYSGDDEDEEDDDFESRFLSVTRSNKPQWNQIQNGISVYDAMHFCNRLSVLFGLEKYYLLDSDKFIKYEKKFKKECEDDAYWMPRSEEEIQKKDSMFLALPIDPIGIKPFANGFRLPTSDEWLASMVDVGNPITKARILEELSLRSGVPDDENGFDTDLAIKMNLETKNSLGLYDTLSPCVEYCLDPPKSYSNLRQKQISSQNETYLYEKKELDTNVVHFSSGLYQDVQLELDEKLHEYLLTNRKALPFGGTSLLHLSDKGLWLGNSDDEFDESGYSCELLKLSIRLVKNK